MKLLRRVGDIVTANLNHVVDRLEEPEKMLRQAVRDMDAAIGEARAAAAKVVASRKLLAKELAQHEQLGAASRATAEKAVAADDDQTARRALIQKREHESLAAIARDQLEAARQSADTLLRDVQAMQTKHAEAKHRLTSLVARKKAAEVRRQFQARLAAGPTGTSAFERFERMREKVELAEAEAQALAEIHAPADGREASELAATGYDAEIETELAEIKRKLQS